MTAVDGGGQGDVHGFYTSVDGIEGILQFGKHASGNGTVGFQTNEVFTGITLSSSSGLLSTPFFSNEKMSVTS